MTQFSRDSRIGFVGAGGVGKALSVALTSQGYSVVATASRTFASAQALAALVPKCTAYATPQEAADVTDVLFITSSDDPIGPIASAIRWRESQAVVHCSGAAPLDVLDDAKKQGAVPGGFHPLQAFASVDEAVKNLPGSTFGIEADGDLGSFLNSMAVDLGGFPIRLKSEDRPLYHASVVTVGGLLMALIGIVADVWRAFGIEREDALKSLLPIIQGCTDTIRASGLPGGLAGPYARGDVGTVRKHVEALSSGAPELLPIYCHIALGGLPLALEKGNFGPQRAAEIRDILQEALDSRSG